MFNVGKAITTWRRELSATGIGNATLDELENHLRDDIEQQLQAGLNAEDAFRVAIARIGEPAALQKEFSKVGGIKAGSLIRILRIACFITAPIMILAAAPGMFEREVEMWGRAAQFIPLCAAAIYIAGLPFFYWRLPDPDRPGVGILIKLMSVCFAVLPMVALLDALKVIHMHASYTSVMLFSYLYVVVAFSALGYTCRTLELRDAQPLKGEEPGELDPLAHSALQAAHQEAASLGHDFVGTEHILLGILANQSPLLKKLCLRWKLDVGTVRRQVIDLVSLGTARSAGPLPYTPRARAALAFAAEESQRMKQAGICVEHLILGLLREPEGVAGRVMRQSGLQLGKVRADILRAWNDDGEGPALVAAS